MELTTVNIKYQLFFKRFVFLHINIIYFHSYYSTYLKKQLISEALVKGVADIIKSEGENMHVLQQRKYVSPQIPIYLKISQ